MTPRKLLNQTSHHYKTAKEAVEILPPSLTRVVSVRSGRMPQQSLKKFNIDLATLISSNFLLSKTLSPDTLNNEVTQALRLDKVRNT